MTTNLHSTKPETILFGTNRKGRQIAFVNFNPRQIEDEQLNGYNWEADGGRYILADFSVQSLLSLIEPEMLVKANEEEILAILTAFRVKDEVEAWKMIRKAQIKAYDSSDAVNQFYLNGNGMWLDKGTRVGLENSIQKERNVGRSITVLWYNNRQFQIPVDMALELLTQLELYAVDCYNVTAKHLAEIEEADCLESLQQFDIKADYPKQLDLKLPE